LERLKNIILKEIRDAKKNMMGVKNVNVLISEKINPLV
jgi:hypothetical protein